MSSIPISIEGFACLSVQLEDLKKERPVVIQAIKEAREEGDLSENAGYDAARERQGMLEAKIDFIESRMPKFNVIDVNTLRSNKVIFGATVKLVDLDTDQEKVFLLVGPDETSFVKSKNAISVFSPVGKALLGKEVGDDASVDAPKGIIQYEILDLFFEGTYISKAELEK